MTRPAADSLTHADLQRAALVEAVKIAIVNNIFKQAKDSGWLNLLQLSGDYIRFDDALELPQLATAAIAAYEQHMAESGMVKGDDNV